jgi:hypothetical protein
MAPATAASWSREAFASSVPSSSSQRSSKCEPSTPSTADNDPHGERDYGSFDLQGRRIVWKIDYYNPWLTGGSEDSSDPLQTCRVLTIMLPEDY